MLSRILQFTINKYRGQTIAILLVVFFVKPLHRIIYISDRFENTPVEKYKKDPLLKTNRYKKDVVYNLPVFSHEISKKKTNVSAFNAIVKAFNWNSIRHWHLVSIGLPETRDSNWVRIFILFQNLRI